MPPDRGVAVGGGLDDPDDCEPSPRDEAMQDLADAVDAVAQHASKAEKVDMADGRQGWQDWVEKACLEVQALPASS